MDLHHSWARWFLPKRLRTIMIVNLAVAILMGVVMAARPAIARNGSAIANMMLLLLAVSILGAILTLPMAVVQMYLYPKKRGLWYTWENAPKHPAGLDDGVPRHVRYPRSAEATWLRSHWQRVLSVKTPRTRLFENAPARESVSRAALLLTVAHQMEASGKKDAARECYRQIIDRFAATPEAHEAARRMDGTVP
jgi:hypothetical protein